MLFRAVAFVTLKRGTKSKGLLPTDLHGYCVSQNGKPSCEENCYTFSSVISRQGVTSVLWAKDKSCESYKKAHSFLHRSWQYTCQVYLRGEKKKMQPNDRLLEGD